MKHKIIVTSIISCFFYGALNSSTISAVYNLRIAETTQRIILNRQSSEHPFLAAVTIFDIWRKKYDGTRQGSTGGLAHFAYSKPTYYARVDFAAGNVRERLDKVHSDRTQVDDLLFSAGYSRATSKHTRVTFSGLLGIPTHQDLAFQGIEFGTGHVGTGLQVDGAYNYAGTYDHFVSVAARIIHFFPRMVDVPIGQLCKPFNFHVGNLFDFFATYRFGWKKKQGIEIGYNPECLFGARISPYLDDVAQQTDYIRSSFFAAYKRLIPVRDLVSAITVAASYGFDNRPKVFSIKNSVTVWFAWGINF